MCVYARAHLKNAKMKRQWCSAQHRNRRTRRQTSCAIRGVHSSTLIPSGRPAKRAVNVARCSGDLPKVSCSQNHTCQLTQDFFLYGFECVRDHNNINTPLSDLLKIFYLLVRKQQRAWGDWVVGCSSLLTSSCPTPRSRFLIRSVRTLRVPFYVRAASILLLTVEKKKNGGRRYKEKNYKKNIEKGVKYRV